MTNTTFLIIFIPILAILLLAIYLILALYNYYQEENRKLFTNNRVYHNKYLNFIRLENIPHFTFIIVSLTFIPIWLEWNITYFSILVLLTLGAIISLELISNSYNKQVYYDGNFLGIFIGHYLSLVENTIANSAFNDTFSSILIIIGLSLTVLNLFTTKKSMSIKDKMIAIWKNKGILFIFVLVIFTINMVLFLLGLAIILDTSSLTLFFYTYFTRVIMLKLVLIFISYTITREFKVDNISLSLSSVLFMFLLGGISYYYVIPFVKVHLPLTLMHLKCFNTLI